MGPAGDINGQTEGMAAQNYHVSGAINAVLADPSNVNILYAGAVNGGVWKTTNATSSSPAWTPLTDSFPSLSIGAMAFDPSDATHQTLVAGIGRFSSDAFLGGPRTGLLQSTNGGASWTSINGGMSGKNVSGVAEVGGTIVAAVDIADSFTYGNVGIYRSTNGGASFSQISYGPGNGMSVGPDGLPGGRCYDIAQDPANSNILYAAIRDATTSGTNLNGIYKSTDTGSTWTRVSNATMNALNTDSGINSTANIEMSVGNSGQVYAGFINSSGQLSGLFRSDSGASTWTQLDTPGVLQNGTFVGLQPDDDPAYIPLIGQPVVDPGHQGIIHFSMQADPINANLLYIAGDRQPSQLNGLGQETGGFPNSVGAANYSGRVFRVDASLASGSQSLALTNTVSTTVNVQMPNGSSPHADSRGMTMDAAGNLVEVDDGGIFKRSIPTGTGVWTSANGNLQVSELHSIAYDHVTHRPFGGTQDTGNIAQPAGGGTVWDTTFQGDGAKVAVFPLSSTQSVRYFSYVYLQDFIRQVVNSDGSTFSATFQSLHISAGPGAGQSIYSYDTGVQFYNPIATNHINGNLVLGGTNIFESSDGGNNFTNLTPTGGGKINAIDAGGMLGGVPHPEILFVGAGSVVYSRTASAGPVTLDANYTGLAVTDLVMDPQDWQDLVVTDASHVYLSTNGGVSFTNITDSLLGTNLHTVEVLHLSGSQEFAGAPATAGQDLILVGADNGVFYTSELSPGAWTLLETLPTAPVEDLHYDATDGVLAASTLGRGAFELNVVAVPEPSSIALLAIGCLALIGAKRRAKAK